VQAEEAPVAACVEDGVLSCGDGVDVKARGDGVKRRRRRGDGVKSRGDSVAATPSTMSVSAIDVRRRRDVAAMTSPRPVIPSKRATSRRRRGGVRVRDATT
jgi:hypothetical protein